MNQHKHTVRSGILLAGLLALACILSGCGAKTDSLTSNQGESHFIYVGLNDADTDQQTLTVDEAIEKIKPTLVDAKQGCTIIPTWGGYVNKAGEYCTNDTILIIMTAPEETIKSLIDQWTKALHVGTIYVEKYAVEYDFVSTKV